MPLFMDRHDLAGATAEDLAKAHALDDKVQEKFGVRYVSYWFDYERQAAFCLVDSPDTKAAEDVHRESHGLLANEIIEVHPDQVRAFLGPIRKVPLGESYEETAFRSILFTDIEGSTALTQRLGDSAAMKVLRRHDDIVRDALRGAEGNEVKHTGDGIMASFTSASRAVGCAIAIQKQLADHNSKRRKRRSRSGSASLPANRSRIRATCSVPAFSSLPGCAPTRSRAASWRRPRFGTSRWGKASSSSIRASWLYGDSRSRFARTRCTGDRANLWVTSSASPGQTRYGSVTYCPRKFRADSVSNRYTTFVDRQTASPVIVIAAMMFVEPRKFGPPESP